MVTFVVYVGDPVSVISEYSFFPIFLMVRIPRSCDNLVGIRMTFHHAVAFATRAPGWHGPDLCSSPQKCDGLQLQVTGP